MKRSLLFASFVCAVGTCVIDARQSQSVPPPAQTTAGQAAVPQSPMGGSSMVTVTIPGASPKERADKFMAAADQYAKGDFSGAGTAIAHLPFSDSLIDELHKRVPPWIDANGPDDHDHRRVTIAIFALEYLHAQPVPTSTGGSKIWPVGEADQRLLEWACQLWREDRQPRPAERVSYEASIALLESVQALDALDRHLPHAAQRFPQDGRIALARAVSAELRTWPEVRGDTGKSAIAKAAALPKLFEQAAAHADVRAEAELRWGYVELRQQHTTEALAHFDAVQAGDDHFVAYLTHLLRGRALERADRVVEATTEYRHAHELAPLAQSAALALATSLVRQDERTDAIAVVNAAVAPAIARGNISNVSIEEIDPWWAYGTGDRRLWPQLIADLRKEVHQ